jgi:protein phosphatase
MQESEVVQVETTRKPSRSRAPELIRVRMEVDGLTDTGRVRPANEDNFVIAELVRTLRITKSSLEIADDSQWSAGAQGQILAVADGIAFNGAGDLASSLSLHTLVRYAATSMPWSFATDDRERSELLADFAATFERCHARLLRTAEQMGRRDRPMGTTLTVAYVSWPDLFLSHAGDSRCYMLRNGELRQLTKDHTLAERIAADDNALPLEEMNLERFENILDNSVGGDLQDVRTEVHHHDLEIGDRLLLCSDGVNKHMDDEELAVLLGRAESPGEICQRLIDEVNRRGGTDNTTAIVCDVLEESA